MQIKNSNIWKLGERIYAAFLDAEKDMDRLDNNCQSNYKSRMQPGFEEYATFAGSKPTPTLIEFDRLPYITDKDNKYLFICL